MFAVFGCGEDFFHPCGEGDPEETPTLEISRLPNRRLIKKAVHFLLINFLPSRLVLRFENGSFVEPFESELQL
ncbi:unnamed protein product, partial [Nesidiocoris tenuis]